MTLLKYDAQSNGLIIEVDIWLSAPLREERFRRGLAIPPAVRGTLIVDTGADSTMIGDHVTRALGLVPTSQTRVITASSHGTPDVCDVYDIQLAIVSRSRDLEWHVPAMEVLVKSLPSQSTDGMLGRDILSQCILHYDGPGKSFTLTCR